MISRNPPNSARVRPFSVWPYFVTCGLLAVLGLVFVIVWWPPEYIEKSNLVKISGRIAKVSIRDDLSDSSAGAIMPGLTSIYFTLEDMPGEFRYPHTRPQYLKVRDYTAVAIDIWVDPAEKAAGQVVTIWQIREHNPNDKPGDETFVSYEDIVERLSRTARSMVRAGSWLLADAAALLAIGLFVTFINRRRIAHTS